MRAVDRVALTTGTVRRAGTGTDCVTPHAPCTPPRAQVASTIRAALSVNAAERQAAEAALSAWEADAAPGFALALVRIVEGQGGCDEVRRGSATPLRRTERWHAACNAVRAP